MPVLRIGMVALVVMCTYTKLRGQIIPRFALVIDELLPDPSPQVQLPNTEFIELKNTSPHPIELRHCKITDGSTTATITVNYTLQPDSFVVVCPNSASHLFHPSIGVSSFPSLNNDADIISLYAPDGTLIHSVAYTTAWYQNAIKSQGGWSLEMIDTKNACTGISNWKASTDATGGTPGRKNSVDAINTDDQPPALIRTYTIDSLTIAALFDEPLDSATAAIPSNYNLNGQPLSVTPVLPSGVEVIIKLPAPLQPATVYQLTVKNISDCSGNTIGAFNTAKAGLPSQPNLAINEILFNPPPGGFDFIELYNRGNTIADLKQLYLSNQPITTQPYLFFPGEYIAITENKQWVQQQFLVNNPSTIIECPGLPSMPDDKGHITLLNAQGDIIDELSYDEKWHFALLDNREGVSLERINYHQSAWTSAASTAGFGTPGAPNSQLRADIQVQGQVTITPPVFSPNNDGIDDFTIIHCQLPEPGYVANITIFDANGHRVRYLVQQATLSLNNQFRWDGLGDQQNRLPSGNYIVLIELFNLQGQTKKFKLVATIINPGR